MIKRKNIITRKDFLSLNSEEICQLSNAGNRLIYWEHTASGYDFYFSPINLTITDGPVHVLNANISSSRADLLDGLEGLSPVDVFAQLYNVMY